MPYGNDPAGDPLDEVRFLVGDTSSTEEMTDEEVAYLLASENSNPLRAAARAAEMLGAKYTSAVDSKKVGPLTLTYSRKAQRFTDLAKALWLRAARRGAGGMPYAGGISRPDKTSRAADGDRVRPSFARRMQSVPGGEPQTVGLSGEILSPSIEVLP